MIFFPRLSAWGPFLFSSTPPNFVQTDNASLSVVYKNGQSSTYTGSDLVGQAMSGNPKNDPETAMAKEKI